MTVLLDNCFGVEASSEKDRLELGVHKLRRKLRAYYRVRLAVPEGR